MPRTAGAQSVAVRAWVEEATVGLDDVVVYRLEIEGERFGAVQTPEAPTTQGLAPVQSFPATQRSASITNGVMRQSLQFTWRYRPLREGAARIDALTVEVGGQRHTTEAISVRVVPASQRSARRPAPDPWAEDDAAGTQIADDDIFIEVTPSRTQAYRNEQVIVTYRLLFRPGFQFRQLRLADSWSSEGFWREEIEVDSNPVPEVALRDGQRYGSIILKQVALFATRSGALRVDPLTIEAELYPPPRARDPFSFLGLRGGLQTKKLSSPPLRLQIEPLPAGAPPGFRGAVGRYALSARYDRSQLEVGESAQLRVRLSGAGNLATIEAPTLGAPGAIEVYAPTSDADLSRTANGISGSRTFSYVLVPRANGQFSLPPVSFTYFDPVRGRYETIEGDGATLIVTGETPAASEVLPADGIAGLARTPGRWVRLDRTPLHRQAWPYATLALPLAALALIAASRRRTRRLAADVALARSRSAQALARKHLRAASAHLDRGAAREFYDALEKSLLGFVGARLNVAERGLTRPALGQLLAARGISPDDTTRLLALLDRCDRVRFAPVVPDRPAQQADREEAAALIVALDPHLRADAHSA